MARLDTYRSAVLQKLARMSNEQAGFQFGCGHRL